MRASAPIFAQIGKFYYKYKKSGKGYRTSLILKLYKENLSLTMQHCINNLCLTTTCKIKTKCIFISFFALIQNEHQIEPFWHKMKNYICYELEKYI